MPPGINLLIYSCFAAAIFFVRDLPPHLIISAVVVCSLFFIPFRKVRGGLVPIIVFLSFTFLSNLFYQSGRVVYTLGSISVTEEGLRIALIRVLRVFDLVYAAKILTAATPLEKMIDSLRRILQPFERIGLPVHEFFSTMALTLKSFPVLKQRLQEVYRDSVDGRGAVSFREKMRLAVSFLIPMFVESMREPEKFFVQDEKTEKK